MVLKFRDLKIDYKTLVDSFEKSESIRREQKDVISDMKKKLNLLKVRAKETKDVKSSRQQSEKGSNTAHKRKTSS